MTYDILLTDGDCRITLSILRSLGKKGVDTVIASESENALSYYSKFCRRIIPKPYPNPKSDLNLFLKDMLKIVRKNSFKVTFPVCEWILVPMSKHRNKFEQYTKIPIPSHESLMKTFDKSKMLNIAKENNVPVPETYFIKNFGSLKKVADKISYPAVVKPRWSWIWDDHNAFFRRASYVKSPRELVKTYKIIHSRFPWPMIQEYIPGISRNYSVAALFSKSTPRAMCAIKVYRAFPISGGNSVLRETVSLDPKMRDFSIRLLKSLDWHGIAEVEFKVDPRDNTPKFMEINGRFWASLELAVLSDIDFPYLLYRLAVDGDIPNVTKYKIGVKERWIEGDIHHLYNVFRHRFGIEYQGKLKTLGGFLRFYEAGLRYDCFERADPLPFFVSLFRIREKNI